MSLISENFGIGSSSASYGGQAPGASLTDVKVASLVIPMDVDADDSLKGKRRLENADQSLAPSSKRHQVESVAASDVYPAHWSNDLPQKYFGCTGLPIDIQKLCFEFVDDTSELGIEQEKINQDYQKKYRAIWLEIAKRDFMRLNGANQEILFKDEKWVLEVFKDSKGRIGEDFEWDNAGDFRIYPEFKLLKKIVELHSNSKEVIKLAIELDETLVRYAAENLKNDEDIALAVVKKDGYAFSLLGPVQRDNPKVIIEAVQNNPYKQDVPIPFVDASDRLLNNKDFVLKLYKLKDLPFWHSFFSTLSTELRDDEEIVRRALIEYPSDIGYVSDRLRGNKQFILSLFQEKIAFEPWELFNLSPHLCDDEEIVRAAIAEYGYIDFASERLRNNPDIVRLAIAKNRLNFNLLHESLRKDPAIQEFTQKTWPNTKISDERWKTPLIS